MSDILVDAFEHGVQLAEKGDVQGALAIFKKLAKKPQFKQDAHLIFNMATCYVACQEYDRAMYYLQKVIQILPDFADAHYTLGACYALQRCPEDAIACYQKADQYGFGLPYELYKQWAEVCRKLGKFNDAEELLLKAYNLKHSPEIIYALAAVRKYKKDDYHLLEHIEKHLSSSVLNIKDKERLYFAKAKLNNDLGDYEKAFVSYQHANDLKFSLMDSHIETLENMIKNIKDMFDANTIGNYAQHGDVNASPIFIVGMPRSGTTLCESIISSHSKVFGAGESTMMQEVYTDIKDTGSLHKKQIKSAINKYISGINKLNKYNLPRITDKMPTNFLYLGMVAAIFPNAKIIHCRRHPLDICLSIFCQNFNEDRSFYFNMDHIIRFYQCYDALMKYWEANIPNVIYENYYEFLIQETSGGSRALIEYCDLDWQDACLTFYDNKNSVYTASAWQVRQPVYKDSMFRYKKYEAFIEPLKEQLKKEVEEYEQMLDRHMQLQGG